MKLPGPAAGGLDLLATAPVELDASAGPGRAIGVATVIVMV